METLIELFGQGKDLTIIQMGNRGIIIFLFTLFLIRISGRRSFGIKTPLDNIIVILLGSVLARAIVGASPFIPIIITCLVIVLLHRIFGWAIVRYRPFAKLIEGEKILLFVKGSFIKENLNKALVCEEDVLQGIRESALTDDLQKIDKVYIERNGSISAIKKNN
ncbi:DUF421 domain-containing protein [Ferruginibacter albus]|uniref:DUF421 domain-containing protein n=1 Tax=Ferruginibacter albus TaxID=2875540 RepID=UPI001CC6AFE9|nr:YetF domain-containing protein [Ferruginibacter albus]UAY53076.1 DUF421 domain-containing protein [Ferruginibacter albus]